MSVVNPAPSLPKSPDPRDLIRNPFEGKIFTFGEDKDVIQPSGGNILIAGWLRLSLETPGS